MKHLVFAICAATITATPGLALADLTDPFGQMLMKPLTVAETQKAIAERNAAKAQWNAMTPEQRVAVTNSMRTKKIADLNAIELVAQDSDLKAMSAAEGAQAKAEREAAQAKYAKMTPDEKAALRDAVRKKKLAELNATERVNQDNDMRLYLTK
jgi:hypothetical protein